MKKIAIIGASYLQLPLVFKAKEMGIKTICFAWETGAVCKEYCDEFYPISITNKEEILAICKLKRIDSILSIASDVAVPTVTYVAENMGLTGNTFESSLVSTNKYYQRNALQRSGINVPKFDNYKNINLSTIQNCFQFPVVIKPVDRSGSKGITVVKDVYCLNESIEYALKESMCGEAIIEEFIEGVEISVETISFNAEHHILAFTDKITTGYPHFVELEHHQPSKFWKSGLHDKINNTVIDSLNTLGIQYGASHSELIITQKDEIYVTEIGARMGGDFIGSHLVQLSTGFDFLKAVIEISLGMNPQINVTENKCAGVCFYSKGTEWVAEFVRSKNPIIIENQIDQLAEKELKESSERSGYFIYTSKNKINFNAYKR